MTMLDTDSPIPIHHQLAVLLRGEVDAGAYPPGRRLPTELELCELYGVSRTPARRALTTLADDGVIVRFRRRGSFVADGYRPVGADAVTIARHTATATDEECAHLLGSVASGRAPDAAIVPAGWVAELVDMGAIATVTPELDPLELLWVPDAFRAMWEQGGASYAIPVSVELHGLLVRRDALGGIGGRPPSVWGDLRSLLVSARDLTPGVSSPFVMQGGAAGGSGTAMATWLLFASAGAGFGGAGPRSTASAGMEAMTFLRRLIDTGLMSPDVVGHDAETVMEDLRSGRSVASIGPASAVVDDPDIMFSGFPGSERAGSEMSTIASGLIGVVMEQSERKQAAEHELARLRSGTPSALDRGLMAGTRAAPVTPHHRIFSEATRLLVESVISGSATVGGAMRDFVSVATLLAG